MFQPDSAAWPSRSVVAGTAPRLRGGVAPSRYDVALTSYIEKQAAHRESVARDLGTWRMAPAILAPIALGSRVALRALLLGLSKRPRSRAV